MKINLQKIIINLFVFAFIALVSTAYVFAKDIPASDNGRIPNPLGPDSDSLPAFFNSIVSVCIELGTIISVLAIMYGGFLYVTAQGDEEKLGKAYKTITWALVGTAILLGSRTIMLAVTSTVKDLSTGIN